eukprot:gene22105-45518_t
MRGERRGGARGRGAAQTPAAETGPRSRRPPTTAAAVLLVGVARRGPAAGGGRRGDGERSPAA